MNGKLSLSPWRRRRPDRPRPKRAKVLLEPGRLETRWLMAIATGPVEQYVTTAPASAPLGAVTGSDGNLWVAESAANELVAFTTKGTIAKIIPVSGSP